MKRRTLVLAIPALSLVGCATGTTTPAQFVADAKSLASALSATLPVILPLVTDSATANKISTYVADAANITTTLSSSASATTAVSVAQQIIGDVQAVAPIVLALANLSPQTAAVINAALSLLPALAAQVGLSSASPIAPAYTPDQARVILRNAQS